ncbi:MAG: DUF86 domain-containing protein [Thermoplasmatota archaeon]
MAEAAERILEFTQGGQEAFLASRMEQAAVLWSLGVIGEAAKRLSPALRQEFPSVPWKDAAALRDRLIHRYDEIAPTVVWDTVANDIPRLLSGVLGVLKSRGW